MSDLFSEAVIGTLHREMSHAREEALLLALDAGYKFFHWRLYSEYPQRIELWGSKLEAIQAVKLAVITHLIHGKHVHSEVSIPK